MKYAAVALMLFLSAMSFCLAQTKPDTTPTLDDLLSPEQRKQMGLFKLTEEEKKALLLYIAHTYRTGYREGYEEGEAKSAAKPRGQSPRSTGAYPGGKDGHWVKTKIDSGKMILLEDGSLWEVSSLDRIHTTLWLTLDNITVLQSQSCYPGYEYILVNTSEREKACAKYVGRN